MKEIYLYSIWRTMFRCQWLHTLAKRGLCVSYFLDQNKLHLVALRVEGAVFLFQFSRGMVQCVSAKVNCNKLKWTNVKMCNKFILLYFYGSRSSVSWLVRLTDDIRLQDLMPQQLRSTPKTTLMHLTKIARGFYTPKAKLLSVSIRIICIPYKNENFSSG
jgi:hypothetical protein